MELKIYSMKYQYIPVEVMLVVTILTEDVEVMEITIRNIKQTKYYYDEHYKYNIINILIHTMYFQYYNITVHCVYHI